MISLGDAVEGGGAVKDRMLFAGSGFGQHHVSTTPLVFRFSRIASGHVFADDKAFAFQIQRPKHDWLDEVRLWQVAAGGSSELTMTGVRTDWSRRTSLGIAYPDKIECLPYLRLSSPRVIESTLGSARLVYQAQVEGQATRTQAWCKVHLPSRYACPIAGRLIERSIQKPV